MRPSITPDKVQILPIDVGKTVVNNVAISGVDYCNSLLAGVPRYQLDRLQSVINTTARLIVGAKKHDHIKHVLRDRLHLASRPTVRPVQAVSADIQDAAWTGTTYDTIR